MRLRRVASCTLKGIGLVTIFSGAALGGLYLHLGLRAPRAFAVAQVNAVLDTAFKGKIVVRRAGVMHFDRLAEVDAEIFDPEGERVVSAEGVSAHFGIVSLLRSVVSGDRLIVPIDEVVIDSSEVVLDDDVGGELSLVRAFEPRSPSTGEPSRGVEVSMPSIRLRHVWVHGHMAALPVIDADVDDLRGAFRSTPDTTDINVETSSIHGRGIPGLSPDGSLSGRATFPAAPDGKPTASAHYEGRVGQLPLRADVAIDRDRVDGVADVRESPPAAFDAIAPRALRLGAPLAVHAEAHGVLPVLDLELRATLGVGEIAASGNVILPDDAQHELDGIGHVGVRDLDLHLLDAKLPSSRITASLDATVASRPAGKLSGHFKLKSEIGMVSDQLVPALSANADFTENTVRAVAKIAERGAPTTAKLFLHPKPGENDPSELEIETDTEVADIGRVPRIGPIGAGRAHVATSGRVHLGDSTLDVKVLGDASALQVSGVAVGRVHLSGTVKGHFDNPEIQANADAAPIMLGGFGFLTATLGADGTARELDLRATTVGDDHTPSLAVSTHLSTSGAPTASNVVVDATRNEVRATIKAASIRVESGAVDFAGVTVEGLGDPLQAKGRFGAGQFALTASASDIDVAKVDTLTGRDAHVAGHVALDVDIRATRTSASGHVNGSVDGWSGQGLSGASGRVALTMDRKELRGTVSGALDNGPGGHAGSFTVVLNDVSLDGAFTDLGTWRHASGDVDIDADLDLRAVFDQLPAQARPVSFIAGRLAASGKVTRARRAGDPDVALSLSTTGLRVVGPLALVTKPDGVMSLGPKPWSVASIDGDVYAKLSGATGDTTVSGRLHDPHGGLAMLDARADLPIDAMVSDIRHATSRLLGLPLTLKLVVPRRAIADLPKEIGEIPAHGEVEASADFKGTLEAPTFSATAKVIRLTPLDTSLCGHSIDASATVAYDGKRGTLGVEVESDTKAVVTLASDVTFDLNKALAGAPFDWEANGKLSVKSFPLDVVGGFLRQPINGSVVGDVSVDGLHHDARLHGKLDVTDLTFAKGKFPNGTIRVDAQNGRIEGIARLTQTDGYAEVGASGGMTWGDSLTPTFDLKTPVEVTIAAKNFRASVAKPFVADVFSEIDGRIDANMKLHVAANLENGSADGSVVVREGVVDVPEIGERFHGIKGTIIMKPWGTVRLDNFVAQAPTGTLTASAQAVLSGLSLKTASAKLAIKKGESIPIAVEGVPMGRAYGNISAKAEMASSGKLLDIHIDVPMLHVDLPQSTGHSVQSLDDDKHVAIGFADALRFNPVALEKPVVPRPPSDLVVRANIKLGKDVEVKRDTTLDVIAQGETTIEITDQAHLTGQIRLLRGKLELQGKMFKIDRGTISFIGDDPGNPMVMATAFWDAPGGIRVIADFTGFVSSGKLTLRSEPSLSQDEILALVLFGSADGSFGASAPPGQGESAPIEGVGIAGGVLTQGLNRIIAGVTTANITTRIDSSEANSPRPEVGVQITKTISARLGYKLGVPTPGDNPDRAQLTVDWRFVRNWSLSTEVGDQGSTAVDIVWRKRY